MKEDSDLSKQEDENSGGWTSDLPPPRRDCPPVSSRRIYDDPDDAKAEEARLERAYNEAAAQSSPLGSSKPAPG